MGKKKKNKDIRYLSDQQNAAYHEAGHVIALISMGLRFDHVDIKYRPDKNRGGHVTGKVKTDFYGTPFSLNDYIICLCGGLAQSYKNNIDSRGGLSYCGAETDLDYAGGHLYSFHEIIRYAKFKNLPSGYNMCFKKMRDALFMNAHNLVRNNWLQIDLIAKELAVKRKLMYPEVMRLLLENNMYDSLVAPPRIKLEPPVSKK